jgi:hypothetical protein
MSKVELSEQIKCIKRELALRAAVYPNRIASGRMAKAQADYEVDTMLGVLRTLEIFAEFEPEVRATLTHCLDMKRRKAVEVAELEKNPAVQAVLTAFEGTIMEHENVRCSQ